MITIIHLITGLNTGGAEMMLYKILSRMDREQFNSIVISLRDKGTLGNRIEQLGIPVYSMNMVLDLSLIKKIRKLIYTVRKIQPDLIQGWMYHGNLIAQLIVLLMFKRSPVLWNIRGSHYNVGEEKFLTAIIIWFGAILSRFPVKIINNSITSAVEHEKKLGYCSQNRVIIPNGFDTDLFVPKSKVKNELRNELGLTENVLLIGWVGRFHSVKDHINFLRAAKLLLDNDSNIHFVMVGKNLDYHNNELKQQIGKLEITKNVHLLGERRDMEKIIAGFDILVSSSYVEGFPNVVGEAMSCEVPCVVTNVGDSAWVVGDTGRVVPPKNSEALAGAIKELLDIDTSERQTLGMKARERIINNFSLDTIVTQYENLYKSVLKREKN